MSYRRLRHSQKRSSADHGVRILRASATVRAAHQDMGGARLMPFATLLLCIIPGCRLTSRASVSRSLAARNLNVRVKVIVVVFPIIHALCTPLVGIGWQARGLQLSRPTGIARESGKAPNAEKPMLSPSLIVGLTLS